MVGLAEVENRLVVDDLINSSSLKGHNYDLVHYDSLVERGIDVALIYNKKYFEVIFSEVFQVNIFDKDFLKQYKGNPFRTYAGYKYKGGFSDHFPVYLNYKKWFINYLFDIFVITKKNN